MVRAADVKKLRDRTGAGMLDCKKALQAVDGDFDAAVDWLRQKGMAKAANKASRVATEGLVHAYIHGGGRIGVLIEVNSETDFVARTGDFESLVHDLAMHVAAAAPRYVSREDVPPELVERERRVQLARVIEEGKPEHIAERIVSGRMSRFYEEICLLDQKFVKDDHHTVAEVLAQAVARMGEHIRIRRFVRYALGEGVEKPVRDPVAALDSGGRKDEKGETDTVVLPSG